MKRILILGGGFTTGKRLNMDSLAFNTVGGNPDADHIVTIDENEKCAPDFVHDLNVTPWPIFGQEYLRDPNGEWRRFDEIHAYEVFEHLGTQGDAESFFSTFNQCWMALKTGGLLFVSVPSYRSIWAFGDPTHRRIINAGSLTFLCKKNYEQQLGKTSMSDYRHLLIGDWMILRQQDDGESFRFVLRAL